MAKFFWLCSFLYILSFIFKIVRCEHLHCMIKCKSRQIHTVCLRGGYCGPENQCKQYQVDKEFRRWITHAHNLRRNDVAQGGNVGVNGTFEHLKTAYDTVIEDKNEESSFDDSGKLTDASNIGNANEENVKSSTGNRRTDKNRRVNAPVGSQDQKKDVVKNVDVDPDSTWLLPNIRDTGKVNKRRKRNTTSTTTTGAQSGDHILPPAANMRAISYDRDLEYVAQCWANYCSPLHDKCRITADFPDVVGQNIFIGRHALTEWDIMNIVEVWFSEITSLYDADVYSFPPSKPENHTIDHVSQLIWAETSHIGCGRSMLRGDDKIFIVVCNYGVGGNIPHEPIYLKGPPASLCPINHPPNEIFENLCGKSNIRGGAERVAFKIHLHLTMLIIVIFLQHMAPNITHQQKKRKSSNDPAS